MINQTVAGSSNFGVKPIDGAKEGKKAMDEIFYNGDVRVSKKQLNLLAHFMSEVFNIGMYCFNEWDKAVCSGTGEKCKREGASILLNKYYQKHYALINKIADEKINGEVLDDE